MEFTGIPLIFFRSGMLICITYFVIRIVDVFEIEREYRLEEALRQQVLLDERERIARELHDGIIQSIYGVGLRLEQALILADKRPCDAKGQLTSAKDDLNHVILDIRDYIQELQPADYSCGSLLEGVSQLVRDFRDNVVMQVLLVVHGQQTAELNVIQVNNILQALRELLTNAAKHSRATNLYITVNFKPEGAQIRVNDDGIGFEPTSLQIEQRGGEKQGLKNVFYRVGMLQGTVVYNTAPGQGTRFEITVPYKKLNYISGVFIDDPDYFQEQLNKAEGGIT
jgi:signal transduction histidine kinase